MSDPLVPSQIYVPGDRLKGRTFLLGNKRALSLSLPASSGTSSSALHPHKWFGAYLYGRKFLEGQMVWAGATPGRVLSHRFQTGFTLGLAGARRDYALEEQICSEEFFVPDGIPGMVCTLSGDMDFTVEPQFDLRFYRALNNRTDEYEIEEIAGGVVVSNVLPGGTYDDQTETFLPNADVDPVRAFAAVQVVGEGAVCDVLPPQSRGRRKIFRKDFQRHRFLAYPRFGAEAADHAPLWNQSASRVYAPVRLRVQRYGSIVYGFGSTRDEALQHLNDLRENVLAFRIQKVTAANDIVQRAALSTGDRRVDTAYLHVLCRMMDTLVARNATAHDTALDRPATMILAGNQYFHDSWKRDENIALGFLLSLGFYDLARDVIRDTWQLQDERTGRLPQRIRAGEEPPYHSSDGTLWALWRLHQYWRCTGDDALLFDKLPMVRHFFLRSLERSISGMLPSGRTTAQDYLWETWMDTPHTPRHGFPVEIQILWIACLRAFKPLFEQVDPDIAARMTVAEESAWQALQRFSVRGLPADSLDDDEQVRDLITPNPFFCFGVGLDLGAEVEHRMRDIGRKELAGQFGIRTLAPMDWGRVFTEEFLLDRRHVQGRRMQSLGKFNYHRGVEWNWLSQFFVQAELKYGEPDVALRTYLKPQVDAALDRAGIGGISELGDLSGTRGPEYQAWSMSGFLESVHAFAGVGIDVPGGRISLAPQLPSTWPALQVRKWYGNIPFDTTFTMSGETLELVVVFPWGDPPDVEMDIALLLPPRRRVASVEMLVNGLSHLGQWRVEPVSTASRYTLLFSTRASDSVQITAQLRRTATRSRYSA